MKLCTFTHENATRVGVVADDGVVDLAAAAPERPRELTALLAAGPDALHAAAAPARAGVAVQVDGDVADVARVPARPGVQLTAEHQAAADARRDHHAQRARTSPCRALPVFGRRHRDAVADERHRQPARALPYARDQRMVAPAGDVDGRDRPRLGVDRAGAADAHRPHRRPQRRRGQFREDLLDGGHDLVPGPAGRCGALRAYEQCAAAVHQRARDLGTADVEGRDEVLVHG